MERDNVFSRLNERIVRILNKIGLKQPTLVQKLAVDFILRSNENAILVAPTGAGKTEAAVLPILSKMLDRSELKPITLIYITPLRALNRDLLSRLLKIFHQIGVSVDVRHGDTPQSLRKKQAKEPPVALITTPETLNVLLWSPKIRRHLKNVRYVIIDEVHSLVDNKRGVQLALALERLKILCGSPQVVLLSATVADPDLILKYFTGGIGGKVINASQQKIYDVQVRYIPPKIEAVGNTLIIKPDMKELVRRLYEDITTSDGKLIVFTNTREMAEIIAILLRKLHNLDVPVHHSSISKELRINIEERLRKGEIKAVIATSSLELGIDIGDVEYVIQVSSPRRIETMLQRMGRAGHFISKVSKGKIYALTIDDFLESLAIVSLGKKWEVESTTALAKSFDVLAHQIVGIIRDFALDGKQYPTMETVYSITTRAYPYRDLKENEFTALCKFLSEKSRVIKIENNVLKIGRGGVKFYFNSISMIPTSPKYKVIDMASNKQLGELDEKFVLDLNVGDKFVLAGRSWEVISVDYSLQKVLVCQASEISQAPSWVGELMPVSNTTAKQVGVLRRIIASGIKIEDVLGELVDKKSASDIERIKNLLSSIDVIPDDEHIIFESSYQLFEKGLLVVHLCAGNQVNKLLSMVLFRIFLEETSLPVLGYSSDAYRIIVELYPGIHRPEIVEKAIQKAIQRLKELRVTGMLESYVRETIKRSFGELAWYFLSVARRFGVLGEESYPKRYIFTVMDKYKDTIVMEEAINEFLALRGDLANLTRVLDGIFSGDIKLLIRRGISILVNPEMQIVSTEEKERLQHDTIQHYKERLNKRRIKWVCLHCGHWEIRCISDGVLEKCPNCGSHLLSVTKPRDSTEFILEKIKKRLQLDRNESRRLDLLYAISRFLKFRPLETLYAVSSMANLELAVSLLNRYDSLDILLQKLLEAEINYAKLSK
ncbi:MAG: DEAD/DEAH box helicase [Crenarchaeota archaeon]|nr:DEAD/DEAH box helicase [Thermoproteota archaeon]